MAIRQQLRRPFIAAILFASAAGCGDKSATAPGPRVATLALTNVPQGPIVAGSMLTLRAVPHDASGNDLLGRGVTWASRDTTIARVNAVGTVTSVGAGVVAITATCEGVTTEADLDFRVGGMLGAAGGTVSAFDGAVAVSLVAGVLTSSTNVLFRRVTDAGSAPNLVGGRAFEIAPSLGALGGGSIGRVGVRFPLAAGFDPKSLRLAVLRGGVWQPIVATVTDTMTRMVWAPVTELGTYGILSAAVDHVVIGNVPPSGKLYIGAGLQLKALVYDSAGNPLSGRIATWSGSDPHVANVTSYGSVVGVATGSVTVTLTVEGKSATATLAVSPVPVASVTLTPAKPAIYPTQTVRLVATPRDSIGAALTGRSVTWSTSDPTVATVDASGLMHGESSGTATITATAEGKSGSVEVAVLPTPVVDWSRAQEWTTYQGNESHSGYVAAVIDPLRFRQLWTSSIGAMPNPVTAGDGHVFVSTNSYFGIEVLKTLDAATGAVQWSKDFGGIHGVHPPAYGGGTVWVTTSGHSDSFLWGFDAATGSARTKVAYGNQWERYYAPVVTADAVYMAGGYYGGMYSFATADGAQRWFVQTNQYDQWTPALRNGVVYAYTGSYSPKLVAVDAATGASLFEIADPAFSWGGWSMDGALALGTQNDAIATQAGRLLSFDLAGRTIRWQRTGFSGQPAVAAGVIFVAGSGGLQALDESDGSARWSWTPPEGTLTGAVIATDNLLFVTTSASTYAIDIASHRQVWSSPAAGSLALSSQGILFIARPDGKVTAVAVR